VSVENFAVLGRILTAVTTKLVDCVCHNSEKFTIKEADAETHMEKMQGKCPLHNANVENNGMEGKSNTSYWVGD
jgi:hypothetical protein